MIKDLKNVDRYRVLKADKEAQGQNKKQRVGSKLCWSKIEDTEDED